MRDTIDFELLPEKAQQEIEAYPQDVKLTFFWDAEKQELSAIEASLVSLAEAQGSLKGLASVEFFSESE